MTREKTYTTHNLPDLLRNTVGFDQLVNHLAPQTQNYPPYNIVMVGENQYEIHLAVAGCHKEELSVSQEKNALSISFNPVEREFELNDDEESSVTMLHHGIARRAFTREFKLAEHVSVKDIALNNGILTVQLVRSIPDEEKPKYFKINNY